MAIKIKTTALAKLPPRPDMDPILRNKQRLSRAHKRLMSLGQERVDFLLARLLEGQQLVPLVNMIQKEWGKFQDVKPLTLMKELERFKAARVDGKLLFLKETDYGKQVFGQYAEGVNVMESMEKVVGMQQQRVSKLYLLEEKMPTTMEALRRELTLLTGMYGQLLEMQMEMGLVKRAPTEFSVEIAASKAQQAIEDAMRMDRTVESALRDAYKVIEAEFTHVRH